MSVSRTDWQFNAPSYLKSKISPQKEIIEYMNFHLIETSVLKVTKVKLSSLVWKIRHFKGQLPFPRVNPIFHCNSSPKNNLNQHCSTKPGPTTTNLTACWLGTLSTAWVIACMQTAQTNCITVQKHIKLYNNSTPLKCNQATPNAYQIIALCLCNNMTLSIFPGISTDFCQFQEVIWSSWLRAEGG